MLIHLIDLYNWLVYVKATYLSILTNYVKLKSPSRIILLINFITRTKHFIRRSLFLFSARRCFLSGLVMTHTAALRHANLLKMRFMMRTASLSLCAHNLIKYCSVWTSIENCWFVLNPQIPNKQGVGKINKKLCQEDFGRTRLTHEETQYVSKAKPRSLRPNL